MIHTSCTQFYRKYFEAYENVVIIVSILYSIFLVFNINSIRKLGQCYQISNKKVVKQSYICISLIIIFRLISLISFIFWKELGDIQNRTDLFGVIFDVSAILTIPSLLLLISITTYQWYLLLVKNEFHRYLDSISYQQQNHLRNKVEKAKLFFTVINTFFFLSNVMYPLYGKYVYIVIFVQCIFQAMTLAVIGYKIYQENRNKDWTIKYIVMICLIFLGKGILILVLAVYTFHFEQTHIIKCYDNATKMDKYIVNIDEYVFMGSNNSQNQQDYQTGYFMIFELMLYIPFELIPCIIFHHIIQPNKQRWFGESFDPTSDHNTNYLFSSFNQD